ncbi:MAG: iron chelate uptake ABC transporter family permease subunit, partial [Kiritimatiellales bacterium]
MKLKFTILVLLSLVTLLVFPMIGTTDVLHDPMGREILMKLRIPRVLTAFLAGIALAASGMIFQALFRNPLATPDTLGVSGGAAL